MMVNVKESLQWFAIATAGVLLMAGCTAGGNAATSPARSETTTASTRWTISPTPSSTPTPTSSPTPTSLGAVQFSCASPGNIDYATLTVQIGLDGKVDYTALWSQQLKCDNWMGAEHISKTTVVSTPLQASVVAAAKLAGYTGSDSEVLYKIYEYCGTNLDLSSGGVGSL